MNIYKPFVGINHLKFGEDRENLRAVLSFKQNEFLRNEFSENSTDFFEEEEFFLEFDKENKLHAIEFTEDSELWLDEINILKTGFSELKDSFMKESKNYDYEEGFSVTFYDLGIGFTKKADENKIEALIIFSKEYW